MRTDLRLHEHQIDKQHHKIMLHIFIRKPLAPRTLRQSHIPPRSPTRNLQFRLHFPCRASLNAIFGGFVGAGVGGGATFIATVEDVVELGNRVAAFDADGHARVIYMIGGP